MNGDDLHQRLIAFQPQLRLFRCAAVALLPVPSQQGVHARVRLGGLLQQLAQMQQVGQPAFGLLAPAERAGNAQATQHLLEHRHETLALPDLVQQQQLIHPLYPLRFALDDALDLRVVQIEQRGGQRQAREFPLARVEDGGKQ